MTGLLSVTLGCIGHRGGNGVDAALGPGRFHPHPLSSVLLRGLLGERCNSRTGRTLRRTLTTSSSGSSLAGGRGPMRAAKLKESVQAVERGRRVGGCRVVQDFHFA